MGRAPETETNIGKVKDLGRKESHDSDAMDEGN